MPHIALHDISLYYESVGQGQPLVFIHGLGSSTRDWERQVSTFAKQYQVITFDLRGHGQSDKPAGPYTIPMFAADTANLLRALGVTSAHVVGLSLGGAVAFQLALDEPTLLKTLTIVNSAPTMGDQQAAKQEIDRRVGIVQQMGMRAMGATLSKNLFPKDEHAAERQTFVERWAAAHALRARHAERARWVGVVERLPAAFCPAHDDCAEPRVTRRVFRDRLPRHPDRSQDLALPEVRFMLLEHAPRPIYPIDWPTPRFEMR